MGRKKKLKRSRKDTSYLWLLGVFPIERACVINDGLETTAANGGPARELEVRCEVRKSREIREIRRDSYAFVRP